MQANPNLNAYITPEAASEQGVFQAVKEKGADVMVLTRPKSLNTNTMFVKGEMYIIILIASVLVIPMLAFVTGLVLWIRRRHQ